MSVGAVVQFWNSSECTKNFGWRGETKAIAGEGQAAPSEDVSGR